MKLLLFIIALTCQQLVFAQSDAWTLVTPAEYHAAPEMSQLLLYGIQEFTQEEILADKLPEGNYTYDHIYIIYEQQDGNSMNYRYDADIGNDQGWVLRATFIVNAQGNVTKELTSYVYEVTTNPEASAEGELVLSEEENLAGGYSSVDPAELDTDDTLQSALDFGVQSVTDQATVDHSLPESEYEVLEVHSIAEQVVNGMNYRFDVTIQNCAGLVARTVFTVYEPSTESGEMEATLDSLDILDIPTGGLIGGECANEEGEVNLGEEEELGEQ